MLSANNIQTILGDKLVLKGIDIEVKPGEITVLFGPSGAGKTTLLRSLSLLELPVQGKITVDNMTYCFPADQRILRYPWPEVTIVFQQLFLWPHLTLRENISLVAEQSPTKHEDIDILIAQFDMGEFIDRYPNETSLGQRQRAALARALILRPRYLLCDEITSSLDVEQVATILSRLAELRSTGVGILLVTHSLGFARNAGDRLYFLDQGEVLAHGDSTLLEHPENARLRRFLAIIEAAQ